MKLTTILLTWGSEESNGKGLLFLERRLEKRKTFRRIQIRKGW